MSEAAQENEDSSAAKDPLRARCHELANKAQQLTIWLRQAHYALFGTEGRKRTQEENVEEVRKILELE